MKQQIDIDAITPTEGLIDLKSYSHGQGPLLTGYQLDKLFDDIMLAIYVDLDDTGDGLMRDGIILPENAEARAWRIGEVILAGPNCKQVDVGDRVIFPNDFGVRASNIVVSGYGKIPLGVFLNEERIFGTCSLAKDECSTTNTKKTS